MPIPLRAFPRQVFVGDTVYDVRFVRQVSLGPQYVGRCNWDDQELEIELRQTSFDRLDTFIHEVMHAMEEEYGIEIDHALLTKIATAFADVIRLNLESAAQEARPRSVPRQEKPQARAARTTKAREAASKRKARSKRRKRPRQ